MKKITMVVVLMFGSISFAALAKNQAKPGFVAVTKSEPVTLPCGKVVETCLNCNTNPPKTMVNASGATRGTDNSGKTH